MACGCMIFASANCRAGEMCISTRRCRSKGKLVESGGQFTLQISLLSELNSAKTAPVTTAILGKTAVTDLPFENPDGSPFTVDTDYLGKKRDAKKPTAGPFEKPDAGALTIRVW